MAEANPNRQNGGGMGKTLKVRWVKSAIGYAQDQKATIRAMGFRKLYQTIERPDTPQLRGQIHKVRHLVEVEE